MGIRSLAAILLMFCWHYFELRLPLLVVMSFLHYSYKCILHKKNRDIPQTQIFSPGIHIHSMHFWWILILKYVFGEKSIWKIWAKTVNGIYFKQWSHITHLNIIFMIDLGKVLKNLCTLNLPQAIFQLKYSLAFLSIILFFILLLIRCWAIKSPLMLFVHFNVFE